MRISEAAIAEIKVRVPVSRVVGQVVKLSPKGREFAGLCPFHSERTPSFTVNDDKKFYHCFGCGAHGGVIDFVMHYSGRDFVAAVEELASEAGVTLAATPATPAKVLERAASGRAARIDRVTSGEAAQWMWVNAGPARGEIVERWFESRGLDPQLPAVERAIGHLRFHPRCPAFCWKRIENPRGVHGTHPAMIALIERISGPVGARVRTPMGVHVTYLRPDGRGKAFLGKDRNGEPFPARKVFGAVSGGGVMLSGIDSPGGDDQTAVAHLRPPLVVGEGIESTLAAMVQASSQLRGAAALNLGNLQGGHLGTSSGAMMLWNMRPDPQSPPFLILDAGPVMVAIDADMKPLKNRWVQESRGAKPVKTDVSGPQRADICAALAVLAWRRAGAHPVEAIRPPAGQDFNDAMQGAA